MDYKDSIDQGNESQPGRNRLPIILGLAGVAFGAVGFGFVVASALGGDSNSPATTDVAPPEPEKTAPAPEATATAPTQPAQTPSATTTPPSPTATAVPPTATAPAVTSPKFHDIFRTEGGAVTKNATTTLPFRRVEASWNNSYTGCPGAGCIRGRASVTAGVGPGAIGESPAASALVYNTFVAQRADANLLMDLRWKGQLAAVVGLNVTTGVEIEIIVSELSRDTRRVIKALPGMPYSVESKELGLQALSGIDLLKVEGSRSVNIPLKLEPGHLYRIDLKITCTTRASFSASVTLCSFSDTDGFAGVEWTKQVVEYDMGVCSPTQKGNGCIYQEN